MQISTVVAVTNVKINKLDYIKIKNVHASKTTINRTKRQPIEWEKKTANYISDKELTYRTYKELLQFDNK